jgi:pyrroline-5-carboxylate reductase
VSTSLKGTLVLLGVGKMGGAMLNGWLRSGISPQQIVTLDPSPPTEVLEVISAQGIKHNPKIEDITDVEVLLAAVKPQVMDEVLKPIAGLRRFKPLVLSIAAGKTISSFAQHFGEDAAIIRTIPNTPAAIGRGITVMAANKNVSAGQLELAARLLASLGEVVTVEDEALIDAATAVSGSGPAYVFYLTECLTAAAVSVGLSPELAVKLARATVSGSAELMHQSGIDAETLRRNVTSPNGTTFAALQVLMADDGMKPLFEKAITAATQRSRELAS